MAFIASLIGSGAGVIIIGAAFIAMMHIGRLPAVVQSVLRRVLIIAMFAGGSALAVTELGVLWYKTSAAVAGLFGGLNAGIPRSVIVLVSVLLLLGTVVGLIWAPNEAVALVASLVPAVLMLVPGGALHQIYVATTAPAQAMAAQFSLWIAG